MSQPAVPFGSRNPGRRRGRSTVRIATAVVLAVLSAALPAQDRFHAVRPDTVEWQLLRESPALWRADIHGREKAPGPFTFRIRAAAGHRLLPHTHPEPRVITVLVGTYWSAVGEVYDERRLEAFPAGSFYVVPAGVPHYSAVLEGETVFQESGIGPSSNDMIPQPEGAR